MNKKILRALLALAIPSTMILSSCSQSLPVSQQFITPANQGITALSQPIKKVQTALPPGKKQLGASMFSYVALDDGLGHFTPMFIKGLEMGSNEKTAYYTAFADFQGPDNSYIFKIKPSQDMEQLESYATFLSARTKEVTSNDPKVLAQAVNWAFSNYNGKMKVFDILAHGGGFMGIGTDDFQTGSTKKSIMSVGEFAGGLRTGLKGRKLNLVNMLSCLMGNVEAIYELRDLTDYVIASEDSIGATKDTTFDFTKKLAEEVGRPNANPRNIARTMSMYANAKNPKSGYYTVAAVDVNRIKYLKTSVNVLSNEILRAFPKHKAEIIRAYDSVPELEVSPMTGQRDLWVLCKNLAKVNNPGLRSAALAVVAELKKTIIHAADKEGQAANGLSIFMPPRKGNLNMPNDFDFIGDVGYANTRFAKETGWDKVIETIFNS